MNDAAADADRTLRTLTIVAAGAVGVIGLLIWWGLGLREEPEVATQTSDSARRVVARPAPPSPAAIARARSDYDAYVVVRLREHEARLALARRDLGDAVRQFFERCKKGAPTYASEATSWGNRFKAMWDSDDYGEELHRLFAEHVVSPDGMTKVMTRHVEAFLEAVSKEEAALLEDVRLRLEGLPALTTEAGLDADAFRAVVAKHTALLANDVTGSQWRQVGTYAGFLAAAALTAKSGGSAGPVAQGVARWIVDKALQIISGFALSKDEIEADGLRLCDRLKRVLMAGSEEAWSDYEALGKVAADDPDEALRQRARAVRERMRNRGYLGIDEVLGLVQGRSEAIKLAVFRRIGGVE